MISWVERLRRAVIHGASPVILHADASWGPHRIVSSLRDIDQPLIWVDFSSVDGQDERAIGNLLSESVRTGLGAPLFGLGVEATYALATLERYVGLLQPITLAITDADVAPSHVNRLVGLFPNPNLVVVQVREVGCLGGWQLQARVIGMSQMRMRPDEALEAFGLDASRPEILAALSRTGGAAGLMEQWFNAAAEGDGSPGHTSELTPQVKARNIGAAIDALLGRDRWLDAFELAVRSLPSRIVETIQEAGHMAFDHGEFDRFWRSVSAMPSWILRNDDVQYWRFNAAIAVNRWRPMLQSIDRYLEAREAPDLRALRAIVEVTASSLQAAERAYRSKKTIGTVSALGFLYSMSGMSDPAIRLLKEAIDMAERQGRPRLAVLAASNLALAHLSTGRYIRVRYWASWALRQLLSLGIQDELLRISVANMAAYSRLLTGSIVAAEQALGTVTLTDAMLGIPSLEGIVSTLGDLEVVRGNSVAALAFYKKNAAVSERRTLPIAANDLVRAYVMSGDVPQAIETAAEAYEVGFETTGFEHHVGELALGTALVETRDPRAEDLLRTSLEYFIDHPLSTYCAQAAIHLARFMILAGRVNDAQAVLTLASVFLDELGDSGWVLLGGGRPEVSQIRSMFRAGEPEIEITLLGKRVLRNPQGVATLSQKAAEVIALLAARPAGIGGEQLAVGLYGDHANVGTLKAVVSRTRRYITIGSSPYRILDSFRMDYVQVVDMLRNNRVQAALELYRGPLLPESQAPGIVELRESLEESMRQAVLASEDADTIIDFANQQGDDLELWEEARRFTTPNDPRRPLVNARIRRIRRNW